MKVRLWVLVGKKFPNYRQFPEMLFLLTGIAGITTAFSFFFFTLASVF